MAHSKEDLRACANCGMVFTVKSAKGAYGKCPNCLSSAIEPISNL